MDKINKRISELIIQKANCKLGLNGFYDMHSLKNPFYISSTIKKIDNELEELILYRNRLEKIEELKSKINDK